MNVRVTWLLIATLGASLFDVHPSKSAIQKDNNCTEYNVAVESGARISIPVVPDRLLANWQEALTCLVPIIGGLSTSVTSPTFSPDAQSKFLSATGAIRTLMTQFSAVDEKNNSKSLQQLIGKFNALDNLQVISVLAYGARSNNRDMRLNSVVILGNVITNRTTCVLLTQLNDPTLVASEAGVNGRANLLSVISVVAQRPRKQNYDSIMATRDFIDNALPKNDPKGHLPSYGSDQNEAG
jgi:hypothetical protein